MKQSIGKVLVYGANGAQGSAIVRAVLAEGGHVRAFLRDGVANPFGDAVEVARGDLSSAESLVRASEGVDAVVLSIPQIPVRAVVTRLAHNALAAAKAADVKLLVWNASGPVPVASTGVSVLDAKLDIASAVAESSLPWIAIRPTLFMGNLLGPWTAPAIVDHGVFRYPVSASFAASWISWEDLAAFIASALRRPDLAGRGFDVGGPQALTGPELAATLAAVLGRQVTYAPLPISEFAAGLATVFGAEAANDIAAVYEWTNAQPTSPMVVDSAPALAELPITPTRFADWARAQSWAAFAKAPAA